MDAITPEVEPVDDHEDDASVETASIIISSSGRPPSALSGTRVANCELYRRHLEPLVGLEETLIRLLSSPDEDEATRLGPVPAGWEGSNDWNAYANNQVSSPVTYDRQTVRPSPQVRIPQQSYSSPVSPVSAASTSYSQHSPSSSNGSGIMKKQEMAVRHATNWKKAFTLGGKSKKSKSEHTGEIAGWWDDPDDPVHLINACAPTMLDLWRDRSVRQLLDEKNIRLEEGSGLYVLIYPVFT